jgi:hypothetical protein
MDVKTKRKSHSIVVEEIVSLDNIAQPTYTEIGHRNLRCKLPATVKLVGAVSGKQYVWNVGSVVEVDERDFENLSQRVIGGRNSCCGGNTKPILLFEEVR